MTNEGSKNAGAVNKPTCRTVPCCLGHRGFSLVELLVVIVIIGVIAAIGTPQLLGMRTRSSVRADARDVHSTLRKAQTAAVKRSQDACVVINGRNYHIDILDNDGAVEHSLPGKELRPGNSFTLDTFHASPCFNSRGLPLDLSSTESVDIKNNNSNVLQMRVALTVAGHVKSDVSPAW